MLDLNMLLASKSLSSGQDEWTWRWSNDKKFSVKSMYGKLLRQDKDYTQPLEAFPVQSNVGS
ncbi:hypothetical protein FRX31_016746 [Thalictrum thalictroides]|uniref:Uncharacterized protein n=1 Tax=Thalictrum thalictroides TaxID=46969 RepID=A0A7J6W8C8_THATH|nr:hypothetical protein FRX31_016746 [Thalictrum thalictroides]